MDVGLSQVNDTDPPCSPRGKWSLVATKVGPGGLDRAGVTSRLTNGSRKTIPVPRVQSLSRSGTPSRSGWSRSAETTVSCWVARVRAT